MGSEQEVMCEHPHAATVEERLCRRPRVGGQAADAEKEFGLEQGEDHVAELVHGHGLKMFVDLKQGETLPIHINISVPSLLCEDLDDTLYLLRPRISCHARRTLSNWPKIARMFRDQGSRVQTGSQQQSASLNPQDLKKRGESYKQGMQN